MDEKTVCCKLRPRLMSKKILSVVKVTKKYLVGLNLND